MLIVIYYKSGLKNYYYVHVCSNKYYCLLKKKKLVMSPIKIANILSDNKELLLKADVIN